MDADMQILPQGIPPPPPMFNFPAAAASELEASVWSAIAGATVKVPSVNSYVYYFPQGNLEQSSPSQSDDVGNYDFTLVRPWIPCQVISVRFLADSSADQAFSKILLQPLQPFGPRPRDEGGDEEDENHDVVSFAKILTRSDANNGGGFSVPRYCADMILPQLDYTADPPVQTLVLKDAHSIAWEFRHIYRGTPRRHLFTTGWSKFVNAKQLVSGDSVVFIRKRSTNELFVGIRRAQRFAGGHGGDRGEVLAAIETATKGMPFEVAYYPRAGAPDFVVKAEKVKEAVRISWIAGMRVRMEVETDDSSRMTWIQGVTTAVAIPTSGVWCGSPWRMIQINWDDSQNSQHVDRVSPWQVECAPIVPLIEPDYHHPSKKFRALQDSVTAPTEERALNLPTTCFTPSMARHLSSPVFNRSPFPSGIQGARLDNGCTSSLSTINDDRSHQHARELPKKGKEPELGPVSTVLSIGSSYSDTRSPASQSSVQIGGGADTAGLRGRGSVSFLLFGKAIQMPRPGDGGTSYNAGRTDGGEKCT